ncbi:MAG: hypothetical protein JWR80_7131 [Bradyrhizobium sp.]|nr:hypothetical protein [Bradyrhizobium sp.]
MLVKVYRNGPARQRITKGYLIHSDRTDFAQEIAHSWPQTSPAKLKLTWSPRRPNQILMSTELQWFHDRRERRQTADLFAEALATLERDVGLKGGELVPNGFRPSQSASWANAVTGDEHFIVTNSDVEREVSCNLFRLYSPALIALSGRSGFTVIGKEGIASRRLSISTEHFGARYFASASPRHLDRVTHELRRQSGISRIDMLDVAPESDDSPEGQGLRIRCIDGQILTSSSLAHALLCQAIALRARRIVRDGRRVGAAPQSFIDDNRARATAFGLNARFEVERQARPGQRQGREPALFRSAGDAALEMIIELIPELQTLEADYDEIAPLVLGLSLRGMGLPGIRNENDLLAVTLPKGAAWPTVLERLRGWREEERSGASNSLRLANEERYGAASKYVRDWWEILLRQQINSPSERGSARKKEPPARQRPPDRRQGSDVRQLARQLFDGLERPGNALDDENRAALLSRYRASGGHVDLDELLSDMGRQRGDAARALLVPSGAPIDLDRHAIGWGEEPATRALHSLKEGHLVLLQCTAPKRELVRTISSFEALRASAPPLIDMFLLDRDLDGSPEAESATLKILLVRRTQDPNS